jgi:hypothetical protein
MVKKVFEGIGKAVLARDLLYEEQEEVKESGVNSKTHTNSILKKSIARKKKHRLQSP